MTPPEKNELLALLLEEEGIGITPKETITPQPRDGHLPLSFAQQRLWFFDQLEPDSAIYNIPAPVCLNGPLHIKALEASLNEIIRRHEVLRTTFAVAEEQPIQVIAPNRNFTLPVVDLQHLPEESQRRDVQRLAIEDGHQPFSLTTGPLIRATLLRLAEDSHVLLLTMHHIVTDLWSMEVFYRELAALYEVNRKGKPSPLAEMPIQYADFACWQRGWLQGEVLQAQLSYWKQQLAELPPLALPTDRPRPQVHTFQGDIQTMFMPPELYKGLIGLSQWEGVTLFMVLLAAFDMLLYRYTGQDNIGVGSPIANRNRSELEGLIGFFVNTLVLRTDMSGNPTFRELLNRVRDVALEAYDHQDLPFEKLVEELQPERDMSRTPLFQAMFVHQMTPMKALTLPDLTVSRLKIHNRLTKFDLSLYMVEEAGELQAGIAYNTDLFDADTITRMLGHYQALLSGIVAHPESRLSNLSLLTESERHQILTEWNQTQRTIKQSSKQAIKQAGNQASEQADGQVIKQAGNQAVHIPYAQTCLHGLFEAQVEQTPDAVAVVFDSQQLTYRQLNERANQLAHYLITLGIGPDVLVGICVERSIEMVVGLLGVLKAGGAYVPLDPELPAERIAFMLNDAQISVLLTQQGEGKGARGRGGEGVAISSLAHLLICCLDSDWDAIAVMSKENPTSTVSDDNLAYAIYTSGSTGVPKGVAVSHRSVVNHMRWMQTEFSLNDTDRILQKTPFSFDPSVWEFYAPLLVGGQLIIAQTGGQRDSAYLVETITKHKVTSLRLVPTQFRMIVSEIGLENCDSLRRVFCGGEVLPIELQEQFFNRLPADLYNFYGPTEATIVTAFFKCLHTASRDTIPIGRPIANTQIYILDTDSQPVPIGIPGELHIGGVSLARGYLNRPELTAERFIPNPFSDKPGARLYKSGDLARYLPDGNIEFLGRKDRQVKIRGFRIELGEIETLLCQHPDVQGTAVLAREDRLDHKQLVAYVVPEQDTTPSISELRRFLKDKLPEYMIPSGFVTLWVLPLMPNGKVDYQRLPAPDSARPELEEHFVAPRSEAEKLLAEIWANTLRVERVGVHDNFFALGGDSILSIQIIARAGEAGLGLTVKQLFQHQTIAALASVANIRQKFTNEQGIVTGEVPLTPIQRRFFEHQSQNPHHFNQAILLEVTEAPAPDLLKKAIQHLLVHHDALRLRFSEEKKSRIVLPEDNDVPFTQVDLSTRPETEKRRAIEAMATEQQASLNLSEGPLLRVALFNMGAHLPSRLLLIIHHLAIDAVSWRILLSDLQTAYQQLRRGEAVGLPPKTTAFKQWAQRLTEYAQSDTLKGELSYWLSRSETPVASLPVDNTYGANTVESAHTVSASLSTSETHALLREVPKAYNTQINDVLLTALAQSFSRWCGVSSILVDLEGHGREEILEDVDLSRTVGWFTTVYPVYLDVPGHSGPADALKSIKEQLRSIPNRGIGYGLLRYQTDHVEITEKLRRLPQAEVSFNYLGQFDQVFGEASLFRTAPESKGPDQDPLTLRRYLLDIHGSIVGDRLSMVWTYSQNLHRRASIERLAHCFMEALQSLITHCQSSEAGGYTPSDFPLVGELTSKRLDNFIKKKLGGRKK